MKAKWIWGHFPWDANKPMETEILYFRRSFDADPGRGETLGLKLCADSRYKLYVNGRLASVGPAKGHSHEWYYDTVELTDFLIPGRNAIAIEVVHYPRLDPFAWGRAGVISVHRTATGAIFAEGSLMSAAGDELTSLNTGTADGWKWLKDSAIGWGPLGRSPYLGTPEVVRGSELPWGWMEPDYNDSAWGSPIVLDSVNRVPFDDIPYGELSSWLLYPRPIPHMMQNDQTFARTVRSSGVPGAAADGIRNGSGPVIPPNSQAFIELDAGALTTGYLELSVQGGKGSMITITPSECYESRTPPTKGRRDDPEAGVLVGDADVYHPGGGAEIYEPFWFRSFRFVRIEAATGDEALTLKGLSYRETGYPLNVTAEVSASDADYPAIWDVSLNTLRRCMHETYEDCPSYEQLQYVMDTRLECLFTYMSSGDDRLARRAINDFHASRLPFGLLQSRFPSHKEQIIPSFSLHWVGMLAEHYKFFADTELVRGYLPTVDGIVGWFKAHLNGSGLFEGEEFWSYVDWVKEWDASSGMPTSLKDGPDAITSFMFAATLRDAAELNIAVGRTSTAEEYQALADSICRSAENLCWNADKGIFTDDPAGRYLSQHAQVWAVLAGAVDDPRPLMEKCLDMPGLAKCSYSMGFFLYRALEKAGLYDRVYDLLETYKDFLKLGLTTWPEDPVNQRSDCHGWSSTPLYEFTACMLGVKPVEPGFAKVSIAPLPGGLEWAEGRIPSPKGSIGVSWKRLGDGRYSMRVDLPEGLPAVIKVPGSGEVVEQVGGSFAC